MERLSSNIYFFFQNLQSFDDMLSKTNMVMIGEEISSVLIIFAFFHIWLLLVSPFLCGCVSGFLKSFRFSFLCGLV